MSLEENKAVVRRLFEKVINAGNLGAADELYAPHYVLRHDPVFGDARGPEAAKRLVAAHPNFSITVQDELAEGDRVPTRHTARGRREGEVGGVAPTGRLFEVSGICIHRVVDGGITEGWWQANELGMLRQLGLLPSSFPPG